MEHAARHHIRSHIDEDPARYQKLSERLPTSSNAWTGSGSSSCSPSTG